MKKKTILLSLSIFCFFAFFSGVFKNGATLIEQLTNTSSNLNVTNVSAKTNAKTTIVIDAGHGGYDTGSLAANGTYEKDVNLAIALETGELLESAGYQVIYTRLSDDVSWSNDNLEDLRTRVEIGEEANEDYYISIHLNASAFQDGASGFEIYLDYQDETINAIANDLETNLQGLQYTQNRGIKSTEDSSLYVIDQNSVPSMLVEFGFITDENDLSYLCSEAGQSALAQALVESITSNVEAT